MVDRVRMAFVGLGWWSDMLAKAAKTSSRIEIAACHSRTESKMAAFTREHGGVAQKTYGGIVLDPDIDAVVLTTPNSAHAPQAIEAARNGKHVFVEKPMALSVEDGKRMIAVAREANVILAVGHKHRRLARYRKAQELIKEGAIGEVLLAEASYSSDLGMRLTPEMWRWYRKESPGGPLTSLTIHHVDTLSHLVGPVRRVTAFISKTSGKAEADDVVSAAIQFESGALGYLGGSFLTPTREFLQIHGVNGVVLVDEDGAAAYYQRKGTSSLVRQPLPDADTQRRNALAEEIDEFALCIQEGREPETAGEEGLAALAVMEAIIRSAEMGKPVEIKDLI
jgi:UDP-N-acetyl-2-amino-2-deoxyglucuronate dehydrogenase